MNNSKDTKIENSNEDAIGDNMDISDDAIKQLKQDFKQSAIDLVVKKFHKKARNVDSLMKDKKFQFSYNDFGVDINIPATKPMANSCTNEIECQNKDSNSGEPLATKRLKLSHNSIAINCISTESDDSSDDKNSNHKKVVLFSNGTVECNPTLTELTAIIRPLLDEFIADLVTLKTGIHLMIPQIEDGNNFGVEVQQDVLELLTTVEEEMIGRMNSFHVYYSIRADLVVKLAEHPDSDDYRRAIGQRDQLFHKQLCYILASIRNYYLQIHDLIVKNLKRIQKPKSGTNEGLLY
ncbi:proteasome activator complex subunit 3-like [Oppia nitens]|uniref:proteasome activator complex subunit 3-like n=1 Tax=Oppia nitens TaxID=1686743 RepID=UPI0023DADD09|nr:proteasome activator complex subunit 3-like [Oppia nitens]